MTSSKFPSWAHKTQSTTSQQTATTNTSQKAATVAKNSSAAPIITTTNTSQRTTTSSQKTTAATSSQKTTAATSSQQPTSAKKPSTRETEYDQLLFQMNSNNNIILFPLRLETHFRDGWYPVYPAVGESVPTSGKIARKEYRRELCVRIFPDEILLNYNRNKLSKQEFDDGRFFWMQWFIASGSPKREYEAWEVLCSKYPLGQAAWIAKMTRIKDLDKYRRRKTDDGKDGTWFYRRPYARLAYVDSACDAIYQNLSEIVLDYSLSVDPETQEYINEKNIRVYLEKIKDNMHDIDRDLVSCEYIVDYLYDKIDTTLKYLSNRLKSFRAFYDKFPGLYADNRRLLEVWDMDYTILKTMQAETDMFRNKLYGKRIALDKLVQRYLDDPKNDVFATKTYEKELKPKAPSISFMPERFMLIAEPLDKSKPLMTAYSNIVNKNIKLVPDPESLSKNTTVTDMGYLNLDRSLRWLTDYEQAYADGMAISLPLGKDDTAFRYIYVLGIRQPKNTDKIELSELFNGHNYFGEGLTFIRSDSPTNVVDGGSRPEVITKEEEMRIRYEIEVEDVWKGDDKNDGYAMAGGIGVSYDNCMSRVVNYGNKEVYKRQTAYKALWDRLMGLVKGDGNPEFTRFLEWVGKFLVSNVSATGPMPMLRIGNVPYGFLPVTDHEKVVSTIRGEKDLFMRLLYNTLLSLGNEWKRLRDEKVIAAERLAGAEAEKDYLSMMGQTPRSVEVYEREMIDSPLLPRRYVNGAVDAIRFLDNAQLFRPTMVADATKVSTLKSFKTCVKDALEKSAIETDDADVEKLVCEFMDLFTYRLDAWFTGMAYFLHANPEIRYSRSEPNPCGIGAYGWVFNLEENRNESGQKKDKGEYILAPSVQHALTAAVLRSAYLNTQKDEGDPHMCVNLSSMRARAALRMIDGIKEGLSTGVILGADLERYLHDAHKTFNMEESEEMDEFIYPLRKLFPVSVDLEAPLKDNHFQASNYTMQVINGEALLNTFLTKWNYNGRLSDWLDDNREHLTWYTTLRDESGIPVENKRRILFLLIERMYDSYDALNDLLLAEGVHRLVMGDAASFEAISKFMSKASSNLPDPAILDTPMEYAAVSHKAAVAFNLAAKGDGYMGKAEPALNAWVRDKIGDMSNIYFDIAWYPTADAKPELYPETLASLNVQPLEYLYISGNEHAFKTMLEYKWRIKNNIIGGIVKVLDGNPANNDTGIKTAPTKAPCFSLYEDSLRIDAIRSLVAVSRPMTVSDWDPKIVSDAEIAACQDTKDVRDRYLALYASLNSLRRDLDDFLMNYDEYEGLDDDHISKAMGLMSDCMITGLYEAAIQYPLHLSLTGMDKITMRVAYDQILEMQKEYVLQMKNVRDILVLRLEKAAKLAPVSGEEPSVISCQKAVKELTVNSFLLIPHFKPYDTIDHDWYMQYTRAIREGVDYYANKTSDMVQNWTEDAGAVHPGMKLWNEISMFQELSDVIDDETPVILQRRALTDNANYWMGAPCDEQYMSDADSLMLYGKKRLGVLSSLSLYAGMVFDSWVEFVPFASHKAGLAFRCNQPDAEAPQSILLVAYPEYNVRPNGHWDLEHVQNILDSTRFQIMNRAVDPDMIYNDPKLSKIFPLLSDNLLDSNEVGFLYSSEVTNTDLKAKIKKAIDFGIFDYMPGGTILKELLNSDNYKNNGK